tara:strand:- start:908 stop:1225 length:318 start_codon:yes stop_codon:yes gene_type:complete
MSAKNKPKKPVSITPNEKALGKLSDLIAKNPKMFLEALRDGFSLKISKGNKDHEKKIKTLMSLTGQTEESCREMIKNESLQDVQNSQNEIKEISKIFGLRTRSKK